MTEAEKELSKRARFWLTQSIFAARLAAKHRESPELRAQFQRMANENLKRVGDQIATLIKGEGE